MTFPKFVGSHKANLLCNNFRMEISVTV